MISLEKEKFNVDQDNYMWYFRNILVLPDVRIAMDEGKASEKSTKATKKKKKGILGFFQSLFKKKNQKPTDSIKIAPQLQLDPNDSTGAIAPPTELVKKKGIFGFMKKKPNPTSEQKKISPAKKEEEEKF